MPRSTPALLLAAACSAAALGQTVVTGPTLNPANGHRYTLLQGSSWEQARTWARAHNGDLATVEDAAENAWLFSTFGTNGRKYLIGLADVDHPGTLEWSDGSSSPYRDWAPGEPGNSNPGHRYVIVQTDQKWYTRGTNYAPYYVVESSGPLRVPEEFATLQAAAAAMGPLATDEIVLAPGNYVFPSPQSLSAPAGHTGSIRGSGTDQTTIIVSSSYDGLSFTGNWNLADMLLLRGNTAPLLNLSSGCFRFTGVTLDGAGLNSSNSLLEVDGRALLVARASSFRNARYAASDGLNAGSASFDSCIFQSIGTVSAGSLTATFSNCTMNTIGGSGAIAFPCPARRAIASANPSGKRQANVLSSDRLGCAAASAKNQSLACSKFIPGRKLADT